jgi:hypothetical protein
LNLAAAKPSRKIYEAIGRISGNFADVEFFLRLSIVALLGTDNDRGMVAVSSMQFQQLADLLVQLYKRPFGYDPTRLSPEETKRLSEFDEMMARVDLAAKDRNAVIHSTWTPGSAGDLVFAGSWGKRGRKRYRPEYRVRSAEDLNTLADRIGAVSEELRRFYETVAIENIKSRPREKGPARFGPA